MKRKETKCIVSKCSTLTSRLLTSGSPSINFTSYQLINKKQKCFVFFLFIHLINKMVLFHVDNTSVKVPILTTLCFNLMLYWLIHYGSLASIFLNFYNYFTLSPYIFTSNPLRLRTDAFVVEITDISLTSLKIINFLLQKHIKISWQFINF